MPSERVSDGILFDGDISAAALFACCHLAVFLLGSIRFYCCNSAEGGTGGFIVNEAAVMGGLEQYRYP